jgi:hypothetical protein
MARSKGPVILRNSEETNCKEGVSVPTGRRGFQRVGAGRSLPVTSRLRACVSFDPSRRWHAERSHSVEHAAPDFRLGPLIGQSPGVKAPTDDGLVAVHRGLDETSSIVP